MPFEPPPHASGRLYRLRENETDFLQELTDLVGEIDARAVRILEVRANLRAIRREIAALVRAEDADA